MDKIYQELLPDPYPLLLIGAETLILLDMALQLPGVRCHGLKLKVGA